VQRLVNCLVLVARDPASKSVRKRSGGGSGWRCCKGYGRRVSKGCSGGISVASCRAGNGKHAGCWRGCSGGRDEGPERFRDHRIGKLSSREPSTIKGPGRSHWSTCVERDHQSYCRSQPVLVDQVGRAKARRRALLLFAPSLWDEPSRAVLIGPKDIVSHGRVSNLP
jgi:hypothetical protein